MNFDDDVHDFYGGDGLFGDTEAAVADEGDKTDELNQLFKEGKEAAAKVKKPVPQRSKLNERSLVLPTGIHALKEEFNDFRPDPKQDPYVTLETCLKKYQHWAHVMAPRFKFEDVIARCEQLGHKRIVAVNMEKLRLGMPLTDEDFEEKEKDKMEEEKENGMDACGEEEDDSISMEKREATSANQESAPVRSLFGSSVSSWSGSSYAPPPLAQPEAAPAPLTEEQRRRVAENRLRALEIREKRAAAEREKEAAEREKKERGEEPHEAPPQPVPQSSSPPPSNQFQPGLEPYEMDEDDIMAQFEFE